jgi:hypothetical protein
VIRSNEFATTFQSLSSSHIVKAKHAAADPIAALKHRHIIAGADEFVSARETCKPRADDDHTLPRRRIAPSRETLRAAQQETCRRRECSLQEFATIKVRSVAAEPMREAGIEGTSHAPVKQSRAA